MSNYGIALCRVSTSQQRTEGNSLSAQQVRIHEVATEKFDCEIVKTWSLDISSRKGKNYKRKDLQEMLRYCKDKKNIKYLFVDEHDRYMRSVDEYYYWKGQFQYGAGVTLVIAAKPELALNPNSASLAMEFFGVWQGEVSNEERITKTTDKMQARIVAGYYPGKAKTCYQSTKTPGLHAPLEPQWTLMQTAMRRILYEGHSLHQALNWLNKQDFTMMYGGKLDMHKLKGKLADPYYAGIVKFSSWDVTGDGLHKPMVTKSEHEQLKNITNGVKKKFIQQKHNPDFQMSNIAECEACLLKDARYSRFVGYKNHNGKRPAGKRIYYERYMCRSCRTGLPKKAMHEQMDEILNGLKTSDAAKKELTQAMEIVWKRNNAEQDGLKTKLQTKIESLKTEKNTLVRSIGANPTIAGDVAEAVSQIKTEIEGTEAQLAETEVSNDNFTEFVEYALNYTDDLNSRWWDLTPDMRERCKQLSFPGGILVTSEKRVSTPQISPIYSLAANKKSLQKALDSSNGEP